MIMYQIIINFIFFVLLITALGSLISCHPLTAVLSLISTFLNAAILLLLIQAEFLALILLVVYVGAIAVLFLFVVMLLNIRLLELSDHSGNYLPWIIILSSSYSTISITFFTFNPSLTHHFTPVRNWLERATEIENIALLGQLLYTIYWPLLILCSLLLWLALIAAIVLVSPVASTQVKQQHLLQQISTSLNQNAIIR